MSHKLTKEKYNAIKTDSKKLNTKQLIERHGYKQSTISQIRRSLNWEDYQRRFIIPKVLSRQNTSAKKAVSPKINDVSCLIINPAKEWTRLATKVFTFLVITLLAAIIVEAIIIAMLGGFYASL